MGGVMIGIKLADGTYYSILDESGDESKRVVLSPANTNQESVHVPLYQSEDAGFTQPQFIGKVELNDLSPGSEQSISLIVEPVRGEALNIRVRDENGGSEQDFVFAIQPGEVENMFTGGEFNIEVDDSPDQKDTLVSEEISEEFIGEEVGMASLPEDTLVSEEISEDFIGEEEGMASLPEDTLVSEEISEEFIGEEEGMASLPEDTLVSEEISEEFIGEEEGMASLPEDTPVSEEPSEEFIGEEEDMDSLYQQATAKESWDDEDTALDWDNPEEQEEQRPLNTALIAVISIFATVVIIGLSFLFFWFSKGEPTPILDASRPLKTVISFFLK